MSVSNTVLKNITNSKTNQTQKNRQKEWQATQYGKYEDTSSNSGARIETYRDLSHLSPETLAYKRYMDEHSTYTPTQQENDAWQKNVAADAAVNSHKGYSYGLKGTLDNLMDQYLNRKAFNYNFNEDALYDMYKQQYEQQAKQAATNAAAQAAALSGGYGNSYGASAAAQASQQYMTELNNMLPQLQQMALDRYNTEGNDMLNKINMLNADDEKQYGRWSDDDNRLRADRDFYNSDYYNLANLGRSDWQNAVNNAYNMYNLGLQNEGRDVTEQNEWSNTHTQTGGKDKVTSGGWSIQNNNSSTKETTDQKSTQTNSGSGGSGGGKGGSTKGDGVPPLNKKDYKTIKDGVASLITSYSDVNAISRLISLYQDGKINADDMTKIQKELGLRDLYKKKDENGNDIYYFKDKGHKK
ncbi:MAG: hypothetical protein IKN47_06475 [Lachnospiraceae bacterium]|nr:hypothetical protein [Lachnospiraceae bacterium]